MAKRRKKKTLRSTLLLKSASFGRARSLSVIAAVVVVGLLVKVFIHADSGQVLTPSIIPVSSTSASAEIVNPDRGQYLWFGDSAQPTGAPTPLDTYWRWGWRDIEPTEGNYNFSLIDAKLADAKNHGGRFGFSIGTVNAECGGCKSMPDYLMTTTNAMQISYSGSSYTIPDWNNAFFQARWAALMTALGNRYNNDARLAYYETGGYGDWGEWHNYPYEGSYPGPQGQTEMTFANAQKMIDATTGAFSNKTVLTEIIGTRITSNASQMQDKNANFGAWAFQYFMTKPNVGVRNACLGGGSWEQSAINAVADDQKLGATNPFGTSLPTDPAQRYKTNFVTTEWCNNIDVGTTDGTFAKGEALVRQWHVSSLSSRNYQNVVSAYPTSAQDSYILANTEAGYRYQINSVTMPTVVSPNSASSIATVWDNVNVAPTYDAWTVQYQLRNQSTGAVVGSFNSSLDLRKAQPGITNHTDNITIGNIAMGTYNLVAQVTDNNGYLPKMQLAIGGKNSDGSYTLGAIHVTAAGTAPGGSTPVVTPTPAPTPAPTPTYIVTVTKPSASQTISGTTTFNGSQTSAQNVEIWYAGSFLTRATISGNTWTANVDTTKQANGSVTYVVNAWDVPAGQTAAHHWSQNLNVVVANAAPTPVPTATPVPNSGDTAAPSVPGGLKTTLVTDTAVSLSWNASTDNTAVKGYRVYRNNVRVSDQSGLTYLDTLTAPATSYSYAVEAYDAAGNISKQTTLTVKTQATPITIPVTGGGGGTTPPPISITPPGTTTPVVIPIGSSPVVGGIIKVTTPITSSAPPTKAVVKVDGSVVSNNGSLDTTYLTNGTHTVTVQDKASDGTTATATSQITVDNNLSPWQTIRNTAFKALHGNKTLTNGATGIGGLILLALALYAGYRLYLRYRIIGGVRTNLR